MLELYMIPSMFLNVNFSSVCSICIHYYLKQSHSRANSSSSLVTNVLTILYGCRPSIQRDPMHWLPQVMGPRQDGSRGTGWRGRRVCKPPLLSGGCGPRPATPLSLRASPPPKPATKPQDHRVRVQTCARWKVSLH